MCSRGQWQWASTHYKQTLPHHSFIFSDEGAHAKHSTEQHRDRPQPLEKIARRRQSHLGVDFGPTCAGPVYVCRPIHPHQCRSFLSLSLLLRLLAIPQSPWRPISWSLGGVSSLEHPPKREMLCKMCAYEWECVCVCVCVFLFLLCVSESVFPLWVLSD